MSSATPPIIAFELGVGEFRIVTPEAVYQIKVCRDLLEAAGADSPPGQPAETFFKEISEEIYEQIGRLARKLAASVEELPSGPEVQCLDQLTGRQLENAKGQLEEVVKITEEASMSIMDSADQIQVDIDQLKNQLDILQGLNLMAQPVSGAQSDGPPDARIDNYDQTPANPAFSGKLAELKNLAEKLLANGQQEVEASLAGFEAEPASSAAGRTRFDVEAVFQTLYEFCTNESVKEHIKDMRQALSTSFNWDEIEDKLAEMASTADQEDGFFNLPIPAVLKTLYAATNSEDFRTTLKKMNQTAAGIFLDSVLPLEGRSEDDPLATAYDSLDGPTEAPAADLSSAGELICSPADLKAIRDLAAEIENLGLSAPAPVQIPSEAEAQKSGGLYTSILTQDRDTIVSAVGRSHQLIGQTRSQLTHILETLSFQDLSGQRIMKVVSLIGDVQKQLLAILVSVNTKIKAHEESCRSGTELIKSQVMAQEEVDKALEKVSAGQSSLMGPGQEAGLDQTAVNELLEQLGF